MRDVTHRRLILAQLFSSQVFRYVGQRALSSTGHHATHSGWPWLFTIVTVTTRRVVAVDRSEDD